MFIDILTSYHGGFLGNTKSTSLRWSEDDPRDITSKFEQYKLRVKAEHRGTVWKAYLDGPNGYKHESDHTSKDAAKQKIAKILRGLVKPVDKQEPKM